MLKILRKIPYLPKKLRLLSECCGSSIILSDICSQCGEHV